MFFESCIQASLVARGGGGKEGLVDFQSTRSFLTIFSSFIYLLEYFKPRGSLRKWKTSILYFDMFHVFTEASPKNFYPGVNPEFAGRPPPPLDGT